MKKTSENIIQVENLTKIYDKIPVVDNINFNVKKGEIIAFLGPNGAGKSTTIKILTTLLKPNTGKIIIDKLNLEKNPDKIRKIFGIVFQDQSLDEELTAYENMYFHAVLFNVSKKEIKSKIENLLSLVDLADKRNNLVKTFSGGMKRRLEIARGLLHNPKILFLDEPTVGLDPQTRNHIWKYILKLNKSKGLTIFFTTHYLEEAEKYSKQIIIIDHGKIVADGTSKTLKAKTKSKTLEDAFIKLTGRDIRDEEANGNDHMRLRRRIFRR
ncbi:MAG: ATP-binding cassette domain-containing protein [archaeon]